MRGLVGRTMRRRVCAASAAVAVTAGLVVAAAPEVAQAVPSGFTIGSSGPSASRGIASDPASQTYWVADAKATKVYAVDPTGTVAGSVPLPFTPTDIEALQFHAGYLYIGDIGDATASRSHITVYRLNSLTYGQSSSYHAWDFAYPDGPHDAATMMVSPRGNIYIVTRGPSAAVYRAPAVPSTSSVNMLVRVAGAPSWVTDGTFLDDSRVALRTFTSVYVLNAFNWTTTAAAELPAQLDGQALTTALGSTTTLVALGRSTADDVAVPTKLAQVLPAPSVAPSASASATESPSAGAGSSTSAAASDQGTTTGAASSNRGTLTALAIALGVAVLAGVVAAVKR